MKYLMFPLKVIVWLVVAGMMFVGFSRGSRRK